MIDIYDVVFEVHRSSNKVQIRNAVQKLFGVSVTKVNTASVRGKPVRRGRHAGHRPAWKKAFVTLKEGDAIELY